MNQPSVDISFLLGQDKENLPSTTFALPNFQIQNNVLFLLCNIEGNDLMQLARQHAIKAIQLEKLKEFKMAIGHYKEASRNLLIYMQQNQLSEPCFTSVNQKFKEYLERAKKLHDDEIKENSTSITPTAPIPDELKFRDKILSTSSSSSSYRSRTFYSLETKANSLSSITTILTQNKALVDLSHFEIDEEILEFILTSLNTLPNVGNILWKESSLQKFQTSPILMKINERLCENNQNYRKFPNDFIHCLMSCNQDERLKKLGWSINLETSNENYKSVLYKHEGNRQMVLAFKSVPFEIKELFLEKKTLANINSLLYSKLMNAKIANHIYNAYMDTLKCVKLSNDLDFALSFTGYLFGAWLAELAVYFSSHDFEKSVNDVKAVTFESPGSKNHLDLIKNEEFDLNNLNQTSYLFEPNFVNTSNTHLKHNVFKINSIKDEDEFQQFFDHIPNEITKTIIKKFYEEMLAHKNAIGGYFFCLHDQYAMLVQFDETTGGPKKVRQVLDWPKLECNLNDDCVKENLKNMIAFKQVVDDDFDKASPALNKVISVLAECGFQSLTHILNILIEIINGELEDEATINSNTDVEMEMEKRRIEIDLPNRFKLSYDDSYKVAEVNFYSQIIKKPAQTNTLDLLYKLKHVHLESKLCSYNNNPILMRQLKDLISLYDIDDCYAGNEDIFQIKSTNNSLTLDIIKERLNRLVFEVEPKLKIVLDGRKFLASSSSTTINFTHHELSPRIKLIERDEILDEIETRFFKEKQKILVLTSSIEGAGKSSLANEYAHRVKEEKSPEWIVIRFRVDTKENLNINLRCLASKLNIDTKTNNDLLEQIKEKLLCQKSVLFVLDNVNESCVIDSMMQTFSQINFKFLITTSRSCNLDSFKWRPEWFIQIDSFDTSQANQYFNEYLKQKNLSDMDRSILIDLISFNSTNNILPLKLKLTVGYLNENLRKNSLHVLITELKQHYTEGKEVEPCLFKRLSPDSLKTMAYCSFFDLSINFICLDFINKLLPNLDCMPILEAYGFIDIDYDGRTFTMHKLVQNEIRSFRKKNPMCFETEQLMLETLVNGLLNNVTRIRRHTILTNEIECEYRQVEEILKHCDDLAKDINCLKLKEMFAHYCLYFRDERKIDETLILFQSIHEQMLDFYSNKDHIDIANSLENIANVYSQMKNEADALKYHKQSLDMHKRLNSSQIDMACSLNNVGTSLSLLGEKNEALYYFKQSLNIYQSQLSEVDDSVVALTLNNLGTCLSEVNDCDGEEEALEFLKKSLEMRRRVSLDDHVDVANLLNSLGTSLSSMGRNEEAIDYFRQSLEMCQRLFGADNSLVALSLNNVGYGLKLLGKFDEAHDFYRQSLEMRERIYNGNDHLDIAHSLFNIGSALDDLMQFDEAHFFFRQSLEMRQRLFNGRDHIDIVNSLNNVGFSLSRLEKFSEALECFRECLSMCKRLFNGDHDEIVQALENISITYSNLNDKHKCGEYKQLANEIRERLNLKLN